MQEKNSRDGEVKPYIIGKLKNAFYTTNGFE